MNLFKSFEWIKFHDLNLNGQERKIICEMYQFLDSKINEFPKKSINFYKFGDTIYGEAVISFKRKFFVSRSTAKNIFEAAEYLKQDIIIKWDEVIFNAKKSLEVELNNIYA